MALEWFRKEKAMAKSKKKKRKAVGVPLTPSVLLKCKAMTAWPASPKKFASGGDFSLTWRIWTCHGYMQNANRNDGVLTLDKATKGDDVHLSFRQTIKLHGQFVHRMVGTMVYPKAPALASLKSFELTHRVGYKGRWEKSLRSMMRGSVSNAKLELHPSTSLFGKHKPPLVIPLTPGRMLLNEWQLLASLPAANPVKPVAFDLLENLASKQTGHTLIADGKLPAAESLPALTRLHHCGHGTLPWDYYRNPDGCVAVAVTHSRAYILDPNAKPARGAGESS